jgi:hypothetical protein
MDWTGDPATEVERALGEFCDFTLSAELNLVCFTAADPERCNKQHVRRMWLTAARGPLGVRKKITIVDKCCKCNAG